MPRYKFKAADKRGIIYENEIKCASRNECIKSLKRNNLLPIEITQIIEKKDNKLRDSKVLNIASADQRLLEAELTTQQQAIALNKGVLDEAEEQKDNLLNKEINFDRLKMLINTIKHKDILVFLESLLLLKKANFNNIEAMKTIRRSTENIKLKEILLEVQTNLEEGYYMYESLEKYTEYFPNIVINMIKVGELSGSFVDSLEQAIKYIEKEYETQVRVKKIVIPNLLQFIGINLLLIVGTLVAVPQIQHVYDAVGTKEQLPKETRMFAEFLSKITSTWMIWVPIIIGLIFAFNMYIRTPKGKYKWHSFKYKMPIFGELIYSLDFSRLIRSIQINVRAGLRIQDSLEVSRDIAKNEVMRGLIEQSLNNIYNGNSWIQPFEDAGYGTPMATDMLKIGMETDLTEMMEKLVLIMDRDVNMKLEKLMKILPQVSTAFVGVALILLTVVVLAPAIQLYTGGFMFSAYGV